MAKSKSSNKRSRIGRDVSTHRYSRSLNRTPAVPRIAASPVSLLRPVDLRVFEDRRTFHFLSPLQRPAFSTFRPAGRVMAKQNPFQPQLSQTKAILSFADPNKVMVCVRRKTRRQVIFAVGASGGGNRPPRRNSHSSVSCR